MKHSGLLRKLAKGRRITPEQAKKIGVNSLADLKFGFKYKAGEKNLLKEQGRNSEIYKINSKEPIIIKSSIWRNALKEGYLIQKEFYDRGISVAKPLGIFNVYFENKKWFELCSVMSYSSDKRLSEFPEDSEEYVEGLRIARNEMKKMEQLGYKDNYKYFKKENILYNPLTKKVTMLDFDFGELNFQELYEKHGKGGQTQ